MSELRTKLLEGVPYYGMDTHVDKAELRRLGRGVEEAAAAAHEALYRGYREGDSRVVVFDDTDSEKTGQYISFADNKGRPCYSAWDKTNAATDIGIRGANPGFEGVLNPTTVVHGDLLAVIDYQQRGAPPELIEALDATALFTNFIIREVAKPYLKQVADAFGKDPDEYVARFYPKNRRARTLTRAILYHLHTPPGMRPVSKIDGEELLIKEHADKCAFTVDALQSSPGLQYFVDGVWRDAGTEVTCFRSAGSDGLTEDGTGSLTPPTVHRAVAREEISPPAPHLARRGARRASLPVFMNLSDEGVRDIKANSVETHPTGM